MKKMMCYLLVLPACLWGVLPGCSSGGKPSAAVQLGQHSEELNVEVRRTVNIRYLLYLPPEYGQSKQRWPLVLFLHGAGERGNDLQKVAAHGPPKLVAQGKQFPFILVSPQCPKDQWWRAEDLEPLLDEIVKKYSIDQDRIYVTGLSMGGFGTWDLAADQPDRFAAIAPVCGGGEARTARRIKSIPAWVFHGAKDNVVPLERSQEMVDALKKAGANPRFTIYLDAGHDAWTETYNNPELYTWLLDQRRHATTQPSSQPTTAAAMK